MALGFWLIFLERLLRLRGVRRRTSQRPDGSRLSWLEAGRPDAPITLVLVHGLGSSAISWIRILAPLGRHVRVLAIDLPGFGRSTLPPGKTFFGIRELAASVEAFLRSGTLLGPVVLVGQSMGGWVSVKAARRAPDRIEQLILVNTAGLLYPGIETLRKTVTPLTRAEVFAFWETMWFRLPFYYRPFWKGAAAHMQASSVVEFLESLSPDDFINDDLSRLEVPTSILWGRADRFLPIETVDQMVEKLRSTRVHWVARCGHIPALERPREFVRLLLGLARAPPPARPMPPLEARSNSLK